MIKIKGQDTVLGQVLPCQSDPISIVFITRGIIFIFGNCIRKGNMAQLLLNISRYQGTFGAGSNEDPYWRLTILILLLPSGTN